MKKLFFLPFLIYTLCFSTIQSNPDNNISDPLVTPITKSWTGDLDAMVKDYAKT